MIDTRVKPKARQIADLAWASLATAFGNRMFLFVGVAVANVALGIGQRWATEAIMNGSLAVVVSQPVRLSLVMGLEAVYAFASTLLLALVAVTVHRQILLDQNSENLGGRVWPFALWTITVQICLAMVFVPAVAIGIDVLKLVAVAVFGFFATRLVLIFPAVAINAPALHLQDRIAASWGMTRGLFWLIFLSVLLALLPLILLELVAWIATAVVWAKSFVFDPTAASRVVTILEQVVGAVRDLVEPFQIALTAAVASWVYLWVQENPLEAPNLTQPPHEI